MCSTDLLEHIQTEYIVMTRDKKRMVTCCGHCGLFLEYKLGQKVLRSITKDYYSGKYYDAHKLYYVVDNDLVLCCVPSTIAFFTKQNAEIFQKEHHGTIMTFNQVMKNIQILMRKEKK